jgi:antitoxin (DNA-binding transcriptional repressor) of toxin-antitoxin stability system
MIDKRDAVHVSADEMEQDFSSFLQRVEAGETLVIVQGGKPLAEIKPIESITKRLRPFGLCAGEFLVPDNFDAPLPEQILEEFEGR